MATKFLPALRWSCAASLSLTSCSALIRKASRAAGSARSWLSRISSFLAGGIRASRAGLAFLAAAAAADELDAMKEVPRYSRCDDARWSSFISAFVRGRACFTKLVPSSASGFFRVGGAATCVGQTNCPSMRSIWYRPLSNALSRARRAAASAASFCCFVAPSGAALMFGLVLVLPPSPPLR